MTRATQTISGFFLLSSLYLICYLKLVPIPIISCTKVQEEIIPIIPLWLLVSFGAYLLFQLGWGVLTFKDKEEDYNELVKEIEQAKTDLRAKGVTVD